MRRVPAWILALLLVGSPALGWDTRTVKNADGSESWLSVYEGGPPANLLPAPAGFTRNEHSELAHLAFHELGIAAHFGIMTATTGLATLDVVDLNAALFRRGLMGEARFGDDTSPGSVLEERLLPSPAHFAGLPDYTFAVYDWVNKSTLCPSLTPGSFLFDRCHVYFGGYLTVFNSTHFGTQATLVYERYHKIAVRLAARAQELRAKLAIGLTADAAAHEAYVKEQELEALAYEGFAQHFLQDRWSIGHMWERWNGPDQRRSADIVLGSLVGGIAGLIHGSEALTGLPDPMSSPPVRGAPPAVMPVLWRSAADGVNHPGMGDERLLDMYDGAFGVEYGFPDLPVAVPLQRATMLDCSKAGWVEVIRAFGTNATGGYGAWNVALPEVSFPPLLGNPLCWDNWATNDAIRAGWVDDLIATSPAELSRSVASLGIPGAVAAATLDALRAELTALTTRIRARAKALPASSNLARGQIGAVAGVEPGNAYARDAGGLSDPAEYAEPEVLDDLPDEDAERGRDKLAVFGFFNRAHADYWCAGVRARLARLRGSPEPVDQAACAYLADRVYKGTDPAYRGRRREQRTFGAAESDPICRYHGIETAGVDDGLPFYLHPGHVTTPEARGAYAYRSLEAWCRKLPVVDVAPCPDESPPVGDDDWDVAARIPLAGGTVTLHGRNFGGTAGTVAVGTSEGGPFPTDVPVESWSDTEIRLAVPSGLLAKGDWFLQVRPGSDPSGWSIGRAILRIDDPCLGTHPLVGIWLLSTTTTPPDTQLGYHFLPDGAVMQDTSFPRWVRIGTWSAGEDTVVITPCPYAGDNAFAGPDFEGTWSAHPVTEEFGVVSCFAPNQDVCPAMRGDLTLVFDPFGPPLRKGAVDSRTTSNRGYFPLGMTTLKDPRCHGACGETWEYQWPHTCARIDRACSRSETCGGECPEGFTCTPGGGGCQCVGG